MVQRSSSGRDCSHGSWNAKVSSIAARLLILLPKIKAARGCVLLLASCRVEMLDSARMQESQDEASLHTVASASQMRGAYLEVIRAPQATLVGKAYGTGS